MPKPLVEPGVSAAIYMAVSHLFGSRRFLKGGSDNKSSYVRLCSFYILAIAPLTRAISPTQQLTIIVVGSIIRFGSPLKTAFWHRWGSS